MANSEGGSPAPEQKPEPVQHINLKVVGNDQSEISFKIKNTTPFQRLMDAYLQKTGQDKNAVRFLYQGTRIQADATPQDLDMEDGDQIDVTVEQLGGGL
ncbi:hypothetical protein HDV00_009945 [Rhizophlyctis rosea]|nr:hypothetical protein HDV00_009945 [Rhizophlyctis rosea]